MSDEVDRNGYRIMQKCDYCGRKQAIYGVTFDGQIYPIASRVGADKRICEICAREGAQFRNNTDEPRLITY